MNKVCKRWKFWGILLGLMLFAAGFSMHSTTVEVQAAPVNGFHTVGGKTYYYKNGKKMTGTQKVNNKYYYFDPNQSGAMLKDGTRTVRVTDVISTKRQGKCEPD